MQKRKPKQKRPNGWATFHSLRFCRSKRILSLRRAPSLVKYKYKYKYKPLVLKACQMPALEARAVPWQLSGEESSREEGWTEQQLDGRQGPKGGT